MCRRTQCPRCQRPTYAGCGQHVEQVLGDVPVAQRCQCSAAGSPSTAPAKRSWFGRRSVSAS